MSISSKLNVASIMALDREPEKERVRIAIPYDNGNVWQSFGRTQRFQIYDAEGGTVVLKTLVNTNGSGHGALADILKKIGVNVLVCGSLGDGARRALAEAGIALYDGVSGDADDAAMALLAGKLERNADATYPSAPRRSVRETRSCRSSDSDLRRGSRSPHRVAR